MKKIPTLYRRDPDDRRHIIPGEVTPGCEWVIEGEGVATRKVDGTCVMHDEAGNWWARREVKAGKSEPANFEPVEHDETTGKTVGWEPIEQSPFVKFWREAVAHDDFEPGTFELVGEKINGNPEGISGHALISHDYGTVIDPGEFNISHPDAAIRSAREAGWEGIVWHHEDGRMAKLKVRDLP